MRRIVNKLVLSSRINHWMAIILNTAVCAIIFNHSIMDAIALGVQLSCLASFSFVMNDYLDYNIDNLNNLERLNSISDKDRTIVFICSNSFLIVATLLAIFISPQFTKSLIFVLAVLILYNLMLKKILLIGNLFAAVAIMSTFWIPLVHTSLVEIPELYIVILLTTLVYQFSREIIFDTIDIIGDRAAGRQTYPIIFGSKNALYLSTLLIFICLLTLVLLPLSLIGQANLIVIFVSLITASFMLILNMKSLLSIILQNEKSKGMKMFIVNSQRSMILFSLLLLSYYIGYLLV